MPIKFRCPHCRQFLGISRAKAGALTDCPSCGRTIRIPDLDGKVKPLPKPGFNLRDSELAGALDALARMDAPAVRDTPPPGGPAEHESKASRPEVAVSPADIRELEPVPAAEPVSVEPALPAVPAVPSGTGSAAKHSSAKVQPSADPLDELVRLDPAAAVAETARARTGSKRSVPLLIAGGAVLFAIGVMTGRLTAPAGAPTGSTTSVEGGSDPTPTEVVNATPSGSSPAEPDGDLVPALSGRLTYATDGSIEPDLGARVIVFPKEREGTAKLPVVGFRAGADPADQALSRTAIHALGGDYTTTDDQGRYTVRLAKAGEYRVLFLSRFQARDEVGFLEPPLQETLSRYFDRPAGLIGPVAYEFTEFTFRGDVVVPRDHVFQRE